MCHNKHLKCGSGFGSGQWAGTRRMLRLSANLKFHEETVGGNVDFEELAGEGCREVRNTLRATGGSGSLVMWQQHV